LVILLISLSCYSPTLKEMYNSAPANGFYDKEIVLNSGEVYADSLFSGSIFSRITATFTDTIGANVKIIGGSLFLINYSKPRFINNTIINNTILNF